jgi:hypothetical protein
MWMPATQGTVTIGERSSSIDVTVGELFDLLGSLEAGGAMAHVEARKGPFSAFSDLVFTAVDTTTGTGPRDVSTRVKALTYLVEFGLTYRFFEYPTTLPSREPIAIEALAGGRWNRLSTEIGRENLSRDASSLLRFTDPMIGGRFQVPFYESDSFGMLAVTFRGDAGGWGVGSELSWNIVSTLRWSTPWTVFSSRIVTYLGYKAYSTRVSETVRGIDSQLALQMDGPAIGVGFQF